MKRLTSTFLIFASIVLCSAQTPDTNADIESPHRSSDFHIGVELQTKYVWRGQEMMTDASAPVVFSQLYYQNKGWRAYAKGGYATNGKFSQINLGIDYTYKWLNVGVTDYFFPNHASTKDNYFDLDNEKTRHLYEASFSVAPKKFPLTFMIATIFAGNDQYDCHPSHLAYSTYAQIGTWFDFADANRLSLDLGMCNDHSIYNYRDNECSICNINLKYTYNLRLASGRVVPLSAAYVINPEREKAYVNFSMQFDF